MGALRDMHDRTSLERRTNVLLGGVFIVTLVTLMVAALIYPQASTGADNTRAQLRSDELAACRSTYRAEIDDASLILAIAQARSDEVIRRGLAAFAADNEPLLDELVAEGLEVDESITSAIEAVAAANSAYGRAVALSATSPDVFLRQCQDRTG